MEREGQVGNAKDLADLALDIDGGARSMHAKAEGFDFLAEEMHLEARPNRWGEAFQDCKLAGTSSF